MFLLYLIQIEDSPYTLPSYLSIYVILRLKPCPFVEEVGLIKRTFVVGEKEIKSCRSPPSREPFYGLQTYISIGLLAH